MAEETTPGGSVIKRHHESDRRSAPVAPVNDVGDAVRRHVERHLGAIDSVVHERVSDQTHLDIFVVPSRPKRNFYTLVTAGMSAKPMNSPQAGARFLELMLCLPPSWPMQEDAWRAETNGWPIRWLTTLARLPHQYGSWLWFSHTVPNGDPPQPIANTRFTGFIILPPVTVPQEFWKLRRVAGEAISFLAAFPLYDEEIRLKLDRGADALMHRLAAHRVTEIIDPQRRNVAR
jgi:hypothetical protein